MNVLVINGHPRENSLSGAFVQQYTAGAQKAGAAVSVLALAKLCFDIHVTHAIQRRQYIEPDIEKSQQLILWADHLVFIYPTWWGTMPALLKGFIDRVFMCGFAFEETEGGTGYEPLLRGKTAQVITTMDTPPLVYKLIYRSPGHNAMRRAILGFCGIRLTSIINYGPVKKANEQRRAHWLNKVFNEGWKLRKGSYSAGKRISISLMNWLKAIRLQFYPMSLIAYAAGAFGAQQSGYGFNPFVFWLGYSWLFLVEVSTVLSNDYFDYASDKQNRFYGPFTGGSRVIVNGLLSFRQISRGIGLALILSAVAFGLLLWGTAGSFVNIVMIGSVLFILALGYTVPPLKLSYRGLGEITVGLTHSFFVIICGYVFQGGDIYDSLPWLVSLPLFLAVLPSITISGIPDYQADKAASKRTLAVRLGKKGAAWSAIVFTALSSLTIVMFEALDILPGIFKGMMYGMLPHAGLLIFFLVKYIHDPDPPVRIDKLMAISLTYLMWFALIPFINMY